MSSFLQNMQDLFGRKGYDEQVSKIRSAQVREHSNTQKLKEQLEEKDAQVAELERKVMDNEKNTESLRGEVSQSREAADQLICGVTIQIQEMIDKLNEQMDLLDARTNIQIQKIGADSEKQLQTTLTQLDEMKLSLQQLQEIRKSQQEIREMLADMEGLQDITGQLAMIQQTVKEDGKKVDSLRADVGEKIHSENVKCYRNMKALVTDLDVKMKQVGLSDDSMQDIRKSFGAWKFFSFFALIDFAGIVLIILYMLGIFRLY